MAETVVPSHTSPKPDHPVRPERLLAEREIIERLNIGRASWRRMMSDGRAPAGMLIGPRTRRWRESAIDKLIDGLSQ